MISIHPLDPVQAIRALAALAHPGRPALRTSTGNVRVSPAELEEVAGHLESHRWESLNDAVNVVLVGPLEKIKRSVVAHYLAVRIAAYHADFCAGGAA